MATARRKGWRWVLATLVAFGWLAPPAARAQAVSGTLIDVETNSPIPLGLILMYTEAGDSVTATISDGAGRFRIESPEPGSFVLRAAALGYGETPAGVFDLGEGGSITIEYRLRAEPLPIDALVVSIDRPVVEHHLVANGFIRRLQRGLGKFVTPYDIEKSPARSTEDLFLGIPQVRVGMVRSTVGGLPIPAPHLGSTVQIASPQGVWCEPSVYVDGIPMHYDPSMGLTLTQLANREDIDAIEVYRRPAEIPVEFSSQSGGEQGTGPCGVIVMWTKRGLAPGQRPQTGGFFGLAGGDDDDTRLPSVGTEGPAPTAGERIRIALDPQVAQVRGVAVFWEGTLLTVSGGALVGEDPATGRPLSFPADGVRQLQVSRERPGSHAFVRGAVAGVGFGLGMWGAIRVLCWFTCGPDAEVDPLVPAIAGGVFVGSVVTLRGPGNRWVRAPVPTAPPVPEGGVTLSLRLPAR